MSARLDPTLTGWDPPADRRQGERVGPWEITGALGHGERAEVYEVRRIDGAFEGHAALVIYRPGLDTAAWLRRIDVQRAALQRLDHPHIARFFDAAIGADGCAHAVVERVDGEPIDRAAAALPLEARLDLFLQLGDALAQAHRCLLAHGALATDKVRVGEPWGGTGSRRGLPGQVKLIGLGIGPPPPADAPLSTADDQLALGRLLYQVLTGVSAAAIGDPPLPPSRLRADQVPMPQWRRTRRRLKGRLDTIALAALAAPSAGGYTSVEALLQALRAWRAGHTSGDGTTRRGGRIAALGVLVGALGVAAGTSIGVWQTQQAERARQATEQQNIALKQLAGGLLARVDEALPGPGGGAAMLPAAQPAAVQQAVAALEAALQAAPADPALQAMLAIAQGRLAALLWAEPPPASAVAALDRAITLGEAVWASHRSDPIWAGAHLRALHRRARHQRSLGQPAEALASVQLALRHSEGLLAAEGSPVAGSGPAGTALGAATAPPAARLRAVALAETAALHQTLAELQAEQGQGAEALASFGRAEAALRRLRDDTVLHPAPAGLGDSQDARVRDHLGAALAAAMRGRAAVHGQRDELPAMRRSAEAALAQDRERLAAAPSDTPARAGLAADLQALAWVALRESDTEGALEAAQMAWDGLRRLIDETGPASPWADQQVQLAPVYGRALAAGDRHGEALAVYELAYTRWSAELARRNDHALRLNLTQLQVWRARSLAAVGQVDTAGPLLSTAISALRGMAGANGGPPPRLRREAQLDLAEALATWAEWLPAEAAASRAEARSALTDAAAQQPLAIDHAKLLEALSTP